MMAERIEWLYVDTADQFRAMEPEIVFKVLVGYDVQVPVATYRGKYLCSGDGALDYEEEKWAKHELHTFLGSLGFEMWINVTGHGGALVLVDDVKEWEEEQCNKRNEVISSKS
jgi:hypothetical protein